MEELKEHLVDECELTIHTIHNEQHTELPTMEETALMNQFPEAEHPSYNQGTSELWSPEDHKMWYEQDAFDRVLVTLLEDEEKARSQLQEQCKRFNTRRVGDMYKVRQYWCVRVIDVEG